VRLGPPTGDLRLLAAALAAALLFTYLATLNLAWPGAASDPSGSPATDGQGEPGAGDQARSGSGAGAGSGESRPTRGSWR
jgi:hypothetical protein